MKRNAFLFAVLCFFVMTVARVAAAQEATQQHVAGTWTASIHDGDNTTTEQWTIKQDGMKLSGTVKTDHGEMPLSGTIEGAVFRAMIGDRKAQQAVHLYVDGDSADGSLQAGDRVLLVNLVRNKK